MNCSRTSCCRCIQILAVFFLVTTIAINIESKYRHVNVIQSKEAEYCSFADEEKYSNQPAMKRCIFSLNTTSSPFFDKETYIAFLKHYSYDAIIINNWKDVWLQLKLVYRILMTTFENSASSCDIIKSGEPLEDFCNSIRKYMDLRGYSNYPSSVPSIVPSLLSSNQPSLILSVIPSVLSSVLPSVIPSSLPSLMPSFKPSGKTSIIPSMLLSRVPSSDPSLLPSGNPSVVPSIQPSYMPSVLPSVVSSGLPSVFPSSTPSFVSSTTPSLKEIPVLIQTKYPSNAPSFDISSFPILLPSPMPPHVFPSLSPNKVTIILLPSDSESSFTHSQSSLVPSISSSSFYVSECRNITRSNFYTGRRNFLPSSYKSVLSSNVINTHHLWFIPTNSILMFSIDSFNQSKS